ncbi:hypothetical protein [Methyloceanibacter sp.]|uniref:hypothetical protein n=1 Tax=Methyloceanibacter sp. TaxID=1965321 RepID=UPI00351BA16E
MTLPLNFLALCSMIDLQAHEAPTGVSGSTAQNPVTPLLRHMQSSLCVSVAGSVEAAGPAAGSFGGLGAASSGKAWPSPFSACAGAPAATIRIAPANSQPSLGVEHEWG